MYVTAGTDQYFTINMYNVPAYVHDPALIQIKYCNWCERIYHKYLKHSQKWVGYTSRHLQLYTEDIW